MSYHQLTSEERYMLSMLKNQGHRPAEIARQLHRHRSTIYRELKRNRCNHDNRYRHSKAQEHANGRRSRSRRNRPFSQHDFNKVIALLKLKWSPEQISDWLKVNRVLSISHETIYRYIWADRRHLGKLYIHLRQSSKRRRKRYNAYDSRGRLANKRHISERPASVENRRYKGHWEIDTVMGKGSKDCIMTLVERKSGYTFIGKLKDRTTASLNKRLISIIRKQPTLFKTITADNGTEFHQYKKVEQRVPTKFYFATPHHSWERGTNENTNGLIRQYLPKGTSMHKVTQHQCNAIAKALNTRPRKRHQSKTPEEVLYA